MALLLHAAVLRRSVIRRLDCVSRASGPREAPQSSARCRAIGIDAVASAGGGSDAAEVAVLK
jgi:hypothetical protein